MDITRKSRILVVDDDLNLLDLLNDTLNVIGYQTVPAHGGIEALEKLKNERFDVMVTDIKMPDLDGIQLLKKVRRQYPDMPVLFITGYASPQMIGEAAPDGLLTKPFRIAHIEELIEETLARTNRNRLHSARKVLVVDHDDAIRVSLSEALNIGHYVPFAASDQREALHEMENGHFDVVIAETQSTDRDPLELSRHIRDMYPETNVILMGSELAPVPSAAHESAPYLSYLQKPFKVGAVIDLLNRITTGDR